MDVLDTNAPLQPVDAATMRAAFSSAPACCVCGCEYVNRDVPRTHNAGAVPRRNDDEAVEEHKRK